MSNLGKAMKQISDEIFYADSKLVKVGQNDIQALKDKAVLAKRHRSRLCAHKDIDDRLHEMLIIHHKNTYIRPHKHRGKSESFHIIEGTADIVIFDEQGNISDVISMGDYLSGKNFYYRMPEGLYHTIMITSDVIVFHEVTSGPFNKADTIFAPWAPQESEIQKAQDLALSWLHGVLICR